MQVVARLVDIYRRNGYEIVTGLSPRHANNWLADYTFLFQEKRSRTHHLGIAPQCPSRGLYVSDESVIRRPLLKS